MCYFSSSVSPVQPTSASLPHSFIDSVIPNTLLTFPSISQALWQYHGWATSILARWETMHRLPIRLLSGKWRCGCETATHTGSGWCLCTQSTTWWGWDSDNGSRTCGKCQVEKVPLDQSCRGTCFCTWQNQITQSYSPYSVPYSWCICEVYCRQHWATTSRDPLMV